MGAMATTGGGTTNQSVEPWGEQKDRLKYAMEEATKLYRDKPPPQQYSGDWTANFTPYEIQAQNKAIQAANQAQYDASQTLPQLDKLYMQGNGPQLYSGDWSADQTGLEKAGGADLVDYATGQGQRIARDAGRSLDFGLNAMDSRNNPYLRDYIRAATRPIYEDLDRRLIPQTREQAQVGGAYGGTRQGIAEGLAIQGAQQRAADVGATLAEQAYQKGLDTYSNTLAQAPSIYNLGLQPGQTLQTVGAQRRAFEQADIDQKRATYEYNQRLPYEMYQQYLSSAPAAFETAMRPAETYAAIGSANREQVQQDIDQEKAMYNYQQQLPYLQLQQYLSFIQGNYGSQGSTSFNPQTNSPLDPLGLFRGLFKGGSGQALGYT